MAEGARLESVFRGNSNVGSNPTLSAIFSLAGLVTCGVDDLRLHALDTTHPKIAQGE